MCSSFMTQIEQTALNVTCGERTDREKASVIIFFFHYISKYV